MKVLVASVDPRTADLVRMALGPAFVVAEAADGLEARRMVAADAPALMIADETMEHYGAFGLLREIRQGSANPPKMIVILERAQDTWLANWSGADRWLLRPVDAFALADAARELVGGAPKRPAGVTEEGTA
ncbi:MAG: hypothetical protein ABR548_10015 [Actinomycetota bacterium]|nr:hypothetical protein [Actinomycetota bacterium]